MITSLVKTIPEDKHLEDNQQSNFDSNVADYVPERAEKERKGTMCSPIELAIQLQRTDIAKQLVQAGANPICINDDPQILPLFLEFYEFGTNHFFSWLLHEHMQHSDISKFIETVLEKETIIFGEYAKKNFKENAGRHHVHAPLTCGHTEMIKKFVQCFPTTDGQDTLRVKDCAGRTALQIAATNGDLESFTTLLEMYKDTPDDRADIAIALLAAAKANHVNIIDIILRKDDDACQDERKSSVLYVVDEVSHFPIWKVAVFEGLSCIFETLRHYNQSVIADDFDEEGNTLGHIAAKDGNVNLFKVVFPLERKLPQDLIQVKIQNQSTNFDECSMFWSLILENKQGETPLMVAIDNNNYSILQSLQERAVKREQRQNAKQNNEKTQWKKFWEDYGRKLLVHACSSSSSRALDSVKVLISITKSIPSLVVDPSWIVEAFNGSVKAGNDEIVNYFLQNFQTFIDKELKNSALLTAADYGHHRCVRILIKNGADVKKRDDTDKNNCLMKAIEKNHRETVLTILSDGILGPESLSFTTQKTISHIIWDRLEYIQPMTLLIRHMPDIAEWVLNKCALSNPPVPRDESDVGIVEGIQLERLLSEQDELILQRETDTDYVMENKFIILEPPMITDQEDVRDRFKTIPHPVQSMVDYDRTEMLNHNLVQTWIDHKLKSVVPELIIYLALYLLFLANLTVFTLLLPRPGPLNENCKSSLNNTSADGNNTGLLNITSGTCEGLSRHLMVFFYFDAVALILTAIAYLILELAQLISRADRYLREAENYVQVVMFICVIIFAFPVGQNSCWCLPGWKWQIGALAVFFAWINLLLLIRYIPWLKIGERSTMLFNVYINFAKSIYLPILLLVTFAIPIYMLFVAEGNGAQRTLVAFITPFTSLYKVIFQSTGEIGSDDFVDAPFHYEVASIVLFLLFIITIPVLFNNFLIGMAVGETEEERRKAYLSLTKRKIYYIFEVESILYRKIIPACTKACQKTKTEVILDASDEKLREFRAKDKAIKDDIKSKTRAKYNKRNIKRLKVLMTQNQSTLTSHRIELEKSLQTLGGEVAEIKDEMARIKESVADVKENVQKEMAEMKAIIAKHFE